MEGSCDARYGNEFVIGIGQFAPRIALRYDILVPDMEQVVEAGGVVRYAVEVARQSTNGRSIDVTQGPRSEAIFGKKTLPTFPEQLRVCVM